MSHHGVQDVGAGSGGGGVDDPTEVRSVVFAFLSIYIRPAYGIGMFGIFMQELVEELLAEVVIPKPNSDEYPSQTLRGVAVKVFRCVSHIRWECRVPGVKFLREIFNTFFKDEAVRTCGDGADDLVDFHENSVEDYHLGKEGGGVIGIVSGTRWFPSAEGEKFGFIDRERDFIWVGHLCWKSNSC